MTNDFYVYAWLRPCGQPFYIGKGRDNRDKMPKRNMLFDNIVAKIDREGGRPAIVRWYEGLSEQDAFNLECAEIAKYGRRDNGTGVLANMTDGGDGASGVVVSAESRRKRSEALTGHAVSDSTRKKLSASMRLPETAAKIQLALHSEETSAKRLAAIQSPAVRKKIGDAQRGRKQSPETKMRRSVSLRGNQNSLGTKRTDVEKARLSEGLRVRWSADEYRESTSTALKASWDDVEKRASRLESILAANQAPERNAKIKASVRSLWETEEHRSKVAYGARVLGPRANSTTGLKGVHLEKRTGRWRASIQNAGEPTNLGRHLSAPEAARAYDAAAVRLWGLGNCYLNYPEEYGIAKEVA